MKLGLFFSFGVTLQEWHRKGLIDREMALYNLLLEDKTLDKLYLFTYGRDNDFLEGEPMMMSLSEKVEVIDIPAILNNKVGRRLYSFLMPFIHAAVIKKCDLLKSNQLNGFIPILLSKFLFKTKIFYRSGYSFVTFQLKQKRFFRFLFWRFVEWIACRYADIISVSSNKDYEDINNKVVGKIGRNRNYIDLNKFSDFQKHRADKFVFIGRFASQKNLVSMLDAFVESKLEIDLFGAGPLEADLKKKYAKNNNIKFFGLLKNDKVASTLNQYKYYCLCSYYEGTPKTLLEAMACKNVCVVTNVEGIDELAAEQRCIVSNGVDTNSIYSAINAAIALPLSDRDELINSARLYVENYHSLAANAETEKCLYYAVFKND